ncbi:MAG: DUF4139 domain-containing protein [Alphaproteobacteria bacterium]|nr:MAG: DUF4139 domain-containing protein [Alphaproteobacteria bacterium]
MGSLFVRHFLYLSACLAVAAPATAFAQSGPGNLALTIYNDDLALVQDTRQIDLPAGRTRQEFPGVSGRISPETVTLSGQGVGIVEQNFDFDLLSPSKLMEKAVGEEVTLIRTNPATGAEVRERAKVLAVNGGVVLQIGPRIEVLRDDGLPVRVVFDGVPENLRPRPTLSVTVESAAAGARPVTLSYLSRGMGWKADYVTLFDEAAGTIDVQGWVTLTNTTGTTFDNADTMLVAGDVGNVNGGYRPSRRTTSRPGTEESDRERIGDFYLYPLKERTTIANQQTKQVSFLDVTGAAAKRAYVYRVGWLQTQDEAESAATVLQFSSSRDQGLGDALPAGTVRVYQKDQRGKAQFVGENHIDHTPMGSDISLATGEAFDVKVQPVVEKREKAGTNRWRTTMRYTLTNARSNPVTVDLVQGGLWGDVKIASESAKSTRRSAEEAMWRVPVPANGSATVTATFDTRY